MRKQLTKWSRFVVLPALLLLSGCFRPAGDSIQPTSDSTAASLSQPSSNATATSGAPPITLLSPNTPADGTTQQAGAPVLTEVTVIPFASTATATESTGPVTPTLQIITPGISLGIVTPDTPTPLPPPTEEVIGNVQPSTDLSPLTNGATEEVLVSGSPCTYTVEAGDSLYRISLLNDTTVADIQSVNPDLTGAAPILQPGQVIKLPDCTPGEGTATPIPGTPVPGEDTPTPAAAGNQTVYSVQPGDTLSAIASRFNTSVNAIIQANDLSNPNNLSIGQKLIIPTKNGG